MMAFEGGADNSKGVDVKARVKAKGVSHGLHYEILDDPNILAESGWENEEEEYWDFRTCKKYIKMYHINKLWPREAHERQTKDFCCKPRTCNNKHFVHRSEEVWKALFGEKPMSKGYINYSVASMVYAELRLKRKVDWSTFPVTKKNPLLLAVKQKDIPDLWPSDIDVAETTVVITDSTTTSRKLFVQEPNALLIHSERQPSAGPITSRRHGAEVLEAQELPTTRPTTFPSHGAEVRGAQKLPTASPTAPTTVAEDGDQVIRAKELPSTSQGTSIRHGASSPSTVHFHEQPRTTTTTSAGDVLENLTNRIRNVKRWVPPREPLLPSIAVNGDGGPSSSRKEVGEDKIHVANLRIDDLINSGALDPLHYIPPDPTSQASPSPSPVLSPINDGHHPEPNVDEANNVDPLNRLRDILRKNPLLSSTDEKTMRCFALLANPKYLEAMLHVMKTWEVLDEVPLHDIGEHKSLLEQEDVQTIPMVEFPYAALTMSNAALALSGMVFPLKDMVTEIEKLTLPLVSGAHAFKRFTDRLLPTMNNYVHVESQYWDMYKELSKLKDEVKVLKEENMLLKQLRSAFREEKGTQESDELTLPMDKNKVQENTEAQKGKMVMADSDSESEDIPNNVGKSEQPRFGSNVMKSTLLSKWERIQRVEVMDECLPKSGSESRWLGWMQQLQDKPSLVTRAMEGLKKLAILTDDKCNAVEASLKRFKTQLEKHSGDFTKITCWGNTDAMFERLNHTTQASVEDINWALEVEEGWVPYQTLSAHIKKTEKKAVHGFDVGHKMLEGVCSLCQHGFGPEGAITLGHCRHTFHVTCIIAASLFSSICAGCRSPLSPRFYELFGLLEVMPPGHEYNRWTLPLDQGPYKFQNFQHWGKPLTWDPQEQRHGLYDQCEQPVDLFFWMTQNREVELRARLIEGDEDRELFCRSMGGHWSIQHNKFFRFPEKQVRKGKDDEWEEVDQGEVVNEVHAAYNHELIGRALILSKLEEAAQIRALVEVNGESKDGDPLVEVATAFDKRISQVITHWRSILLEGANKGTSIQKEMENNVLKLVVNKVDSAIRALKLRSMDTTPKRNRKRKEEEDDDFSPETTRQFCVVDRATKSIRVTDQGSPGGSNRREGLRSGNKVKDLKNGGPSNDLGEGSSDKRK